MSHLYKIRMNFLASQDYTGQARYVQRYMVERNIGKLTFSPDDDVLDVGCGTGEETKSIAAKVRSVTGRLKPRVQMQNVFQVAQGEATCQT